MRVRHGLAGLALVLGLAVSAGPAPAGDGDLLPARRVLLSEGVDFPGNDLARILDASESGCAAACLADPDCLAFTYNRRSLACFPKSAAPAPVPFAGALSGRVVAADPAVVARAGARAAALPALTVADLAAATAQARDIGWRYPAGDGDADRLAAAAAEAARAGDAEAAARLSGAAAALSDTAGHWADHARRLLALPPDSDRSGEVAGQAVAAAANAYLRAAGDAQAAAALTVLAEALEAAGRGPDTVPVLKRAEALAPGPEIAARLAQARARHGFRVAGHEVESDAAEPRICARFTEPLAAGVDFTPFVQLPEPGLAVEAEDAQLCVSGVVHGARYRLVLRAGLPAASGEVTGTETEIAAYVRDRAPLVRFPGRGYVLPQTPDAGIPVETVNATEIDLVLRRVSDRNLVRALREGWLGRPLDRWAGEAFADEMAAEIWRGGAEVAMEVNRDMTTRLPVADLAGLLPAGIYALEALVPGQDTWEVPAAMQWFVVSDLGLTALQGGDGLHVIVRGLSDAGARPGLTVELVSRANAVLGQAVTDEEGRARFPAGLVAGRGGAAPLLVTVVQEGPDGPTDLAFLPLSDPEFDLSDRGVEGRPPAPPIDVFLATDRGAYRAGETVRATVLVRDPVARAIPDLPLTARLMRPDGVEHARSALAAGPAGGLALAFDLAPGVPRGPWRIEIHADPDAPPLAAARILVEDFLPERIDADLSLPEGPLPLGGRVPLEVDARFLYGAPGAGLSLDGDLRLSPAAEVPGWDGFRFGRRDEAGPLWGDAIGGGQTGADGRARLTLALPALPEAAQPMLVRVALRLAEGSGRPVERRIERLALPAQPLPAIRPMFAGDTVPEGTEARFRLAAIGPDGRAADLAARWVLNRVERRYQWYALYGNWTWEETTRRSRVAAAEIDLAATAGPQEIALPVAAGEYELVLETRGGAAVASVGFRAGWYVAEGAAAETPDALTVALDRPAYRPGDTARARIEAPADGVALVSVLGSRLIDLRAVAVTAGANEIALPVTEDWGAGAYVAASVLRPLAVEAGRAPVRALGLAHAAVDPGDRALTAHFEGPAEVDPRGPLPVVLRVDGVAPGETAYATISAVDAGILNLTGHAAPDPRGHYFGQRRLGVAIRDLYGRLIDGRAGTPGRIRQGGDAGTAARLDAPPPTEDLVAFFAGPLPVGPDGRVETTFDLPAFNGTVRLAAVVWSASGLGQAATEVLVRDPVVVTASAPRFLAPGDESRLRIDLAHATGPAGRVALDLAATGVTLGPVATTVDLAAGGRATLEVALTAPALPGLARITIAATSPEGRRLVRELPLDIRATDPPVLRRDRFALAPGQAFTVTPDIFAGFRPGTGTATLALGAAARFDTPGLLAALDRYPLGCTEQVTSRALPLLYLSSVAQTLGLVPDAGAEARIAGAIDAVLLNQSPAGSFGLWRPDGGDLWLDAYVTDFLSRARAGGHAVPDRAFGAALDNLANRVAYAPDFATGGADIAYALMVLAREGRAAVGDLRYHADVKAEAFDSPLALAQLGAALAAYGDPARAEPLFAEALEMALAAGTPQAAPWRADYGTPLRDAAGVLALAAEAGSAVAASPALEARVAAGLAAGALSTQEQAWALMAARALLAAPASGGFLLEGAPVAGPLVRLWEEDTLAAPVILENATGREEVLTLTAFGVPEVPEPAGGTGYAITRRYHTTEGAEVDPAQVARGTRLVAVIEVTPFEAAEGRLVVDDPLPAGFEIDNPALLSGGETGGFPWLPEVAEVRMAEFRADRFRAALDRGGTQPFRLAYVLRAVSPGSFRHPAATVEDMYRPERRGWTGTGRVDVTP